MPSANNRRNRRMRKLEAQKNEKKDAQISQNSQPLAIAVVNNSIKPINPTKSLDSHRFDYYCSFCNGRKRDGVWIRGSCGCVVGHCFSPDLDECPCPKCPSAVPKPQENSRNVADGIVEVGEVASMALERMANHASDFMTSWNAYDGIQQSSFGSPCNSRTQPMNQWERDAVIRNVKIAKAVVGTAASVTGFVANGIGAGCWLLGSLLSPVVRTVSKQILSEWNVDDEKAEHMVDGAMEIAKATFISTGSVLRGVQNGSATLASAACSSLARTYENTHGFQPRELESDVGDIAKNFVHTAWNVNAIKPKSKLAKLSRIVPESRSEGRIIYN